ncbi:uncharacterized protein LOC143374015 isoform X2 [Andrena cerasifolii]|uniref:uncharacterized protein LOC143374015 isoform X2 n=1 Tax=Andrena cerasifolii TaxID=2819439 RepID=UPI004037CE57
MAKLSGIQKKIPQGQKKNFQGKIPVASKLDLNRIAKPVGRPPNSSKEKKLVVPEKPEASNSASMRPESMELEVTAEVTVQNEDAQKDVSKDKQESVKECVDQAPPEPVAKEQENGTSKGTVEEERTEGQEALSETIEIKQVDEHEENDMILSYETEDSPVKAQEMKPPINESNDESKEELPLAEAKSDVIEKEDLQSESQTDTESLSVEVLESTTSEVSEVSEIVSQNDEEKEKEKEKEKEEKEKEEKEKEKLVAIAKETDVSFVSYDPAIMLKDVQIKLNDCMKENSKLFETSSAEHDTLTQPPKDSMSFGKTLRSMSGRRSLSRMRHVTLREHRYSPNNSMFVNTSMASLPSDETEDFKILRYSIGLSDPMSATNGSSTEKKRKHDGEEWSSALKKQKTESENSLLNTSISLLKGLRRPIQVSTPVSEMKFQSGKLDLTDEESNKSMNENAKKWCIIM